MYLLTTMQGKKLCAGSYAKCYEYWSRLGSRKAKCPPAIMWKRDGDFTDSSFELGISPAK